MGSRFLRLASHIASTGVLYAITAFVIMGIYSSYHPAASILPQEGVSAYYSQPTHVPVNDEPSVKVTVGTPARLAITSLGLDIAVLQGNYHITTATWDISEHSAHFATPSVIPNNYQGNSLIYGHKNALVFEKLTKLKTGDLLELKTNEGDIFVYEYAKHQQLKPTDTTIFDYYGKPQLTLQTCSGSWNQFRSLYYFNLVKVKNV